MTAQGLVAVWARVGDKGRLRTSFPACSSPAGGTAAPFLLTECWLPPGPEHPWYATFFPLHHPLLGRNPPTPPMQDLDLGTSCSVAPQG